ncbi:MAG: hypothetical protein ACR2OE_18255 [Thermomicrobiales bacterium]
MVVGTRQSDSDMERAELNILHILSTKDAPLAPADLIAELEGDGFLNADIRAAIWYLLDRHHVNLTIDLRLALPRAAA